MSLSCFFPPLRWTENHYLHCSNPVKGLLMHADGASMRPLSVSDSSRYPQHLERDMYADIRRRGTWLWWLTPRQMRPNVSQNRKTFIVLLLTSRIVLWTGMFHRKEKNQTLQLHLLMFILPMDQITVCDVTGLKPHFHQAVQIISVQFGTH